MFGLLKVLLINLITTGKQLDCFNAKLGAFEYFVAEIACTKKTILFLVEDRKPI